MKFLCGKSERLSDSHGNILAVQVSDVTEDGVGVRGGGKLHQFALPFGRRGLVHDDANTFPRFDRATPPEWSMIWRSACPR